MPVFRDLYRRFSRRRLLKIDASESAKVGGKPNFLTMAALSFWYFPALLHPAWTMAFDALAEREIESLIEDEVEKTEDRSPLICASCGERITSIRERLEMNGTHAHTFTNPHGFTFDIGCFRNAPGCKPFGEATEEWTWFQGYAWRVAVCGGCGAHLGWGYEPAPTDPDARGFFGLILDRLSRPA